MSGVYESKIPIEVLSFLSSTSRTLLIKGEAGTGKTLLSLELLRHFSENGDGIYISTKVSPQTLYDQIPYLKDLVKPEHVLDSSKAGEAFKHVTMIMDLRVRDAPMIIKEVYYKAKDLAEPFIIVDSWDGIVKVMPFADRSKNEDILVKMVEGINARMIFTSEEPAQTTLDYIVDGIMTLSDGYFEGRRIREIEINKLRGVKIHKKRRVFTLDGGEFRSFDPYVKKVPTNFKFPKPIPDSDIKHVSTGMRDFDKMLGGGYLKGSFNLFEISDGISNSYLQMLNPTIINHLNLGRLMLYIQSQGSTSNEFDNDVKQYLKHPEKLGDQLTSFSQVTERTPYTRSLDSRIEEMLGEFEMSLRKTIQDNNLPLMFVMNLDTLECVYGVEEVRKRMGEIVSMIKGFSGVGLAIVNKEHKILEEIGNLATSRWRVTTTNGEVLLYGVTPRTELYAIETHVSRGYPEIGLTSIV